MKDLNLENYEVSPVEPLHDTKGHIKNIWDVLLECLNEQQKKTCYDTLHGCYGNKDKVRGCDYRLSAILVHNNMRNICTEEIAELLYTLTEINRLAYMKAESRTPRFILRLHNITLKHALLCFELLGKIPKAISTSKLYGIYFHALITHLPTVSRIISPSSLYTEKEEKKRN